MVVVPISRSPKAVRNYVLNRMPMGTSFEKATEIINKKGWEIKEINAERGLCVFYDDSVHSPSGRFAKKDEVFNVPESPSAKIVGVKSMRIKLGEYWFVFDAATFAYVAFDENDELVEVTIRFDIDAL